MRIFKEVFYDIRSFPGITILSVVTIALTLYISGLFGLFYINITGALSKIGERVQMVIFLRDEVPDEEIEELRKELANLEGVTGIEYIAKEDALEKFREELGDNAHLLDDLDVNPLPASIEVRFDEDHRNVEALKQIAENLEGNELIEMVDYAKPWTEKLDRVRRLVGLVGLLTGLVVIIASVLIISFSIGLALKSKEEEMGVSQLIGATDFYISRPYLVEGLIKGLAGGLIALLLLTLTRKLAVAGLYPFSFFSRTQIVAGILAGGIIGTAGAAFSVRSFLRALVLAGLLISLQATTLSPLYASSQDPQKIEEEIEKEQSELERIRNELKENEAEAKRLKSKEKSVLGEIQNIDQKIDLKSKLISKLKKQIQLEEKELQDISRKLKDTSVRLDHTKRILGKRLRLVYEKGILSPLEVVFESSSLPRLGLRIEYLSRILAYDRKLVREISELKEDIAVKENEKEAMLKSIALRKEEVDLEKRSLESASAEKRKLLSSVKKEKSKREKAIAELREREDKLQNLIQKLEEQRLLAERMGERREAPIEKRFGKLPWPVKGKVITKFGTQYNPIYKTRIPSQGIDISARLGTPVKAVEAGKVEYADWWQTFGKMIILNHGGGYYTIYAHLDEIAASTGIDVLRGQQIGTVGKTGSLKGPYLHFELRRGKEALDPLKWLAAR
ncbi:MAG: permease-like cell division protein FtsX [Candidatus Glassbacteria bacterium]